MHRFISVILLVFSFVGLRAQFSCDNVTSAVTNIDLRGLTGQTASIPISTTDGLCCSNGSQSGNVQCGTIHISLDPNDLGYKLTLDGAPALGNFRYKVDDCSSPEQSFASATICVSSTDEELYINICKSGTNSYNVILEPINGDINPFIGTVGSGCDIQVVPDPLQVAASISWTTVSANANLSYLSCTNCLNPIFTVPNGVSGIFEYEVCSDFTDPLCGTFNVCRSVTFTVDAPPTITCPTDVIVACSAAIPPAATSFATFISAGGTTSNNGAYKSNAVSSSDASDGNTCPTVITRTYTLTDSCGNVEMCEQMITVEPPAFSWTSALPANTTISCDSATRHVVPSLNYSNGLAANNVCYSTGVAAPSVVRNFDACGGTIEVTWSYTDPCNGLQEHMQTIVVSEAPVPTFLPIIIEREISCEGAILYTPPSRTYSNLLSGPCLLRGTDDNPTVVKNFDACGGTIDVYYNATDACGRTVPEAQMSIIVSPAPVPMWINPPANTTISCEDVAAFVPTPLSYSNNLTGLCLRSGEGTPTVTPLFTECGGSLQVTYNATDCSSNLPPYTQYIQVIPAAAPQWVDPPANITITCAEAASFIPGIANYDNGLTGTCEISGSVVGRKTTDFISPCTGGFFEVEYGIITTCPTIMYPPPYRQTVTYTAAPAPQFVNLPTDLTISCTEAETYIPPTIQYTNGETGACQIAGNVPGMIQNRNYTACGGTMTVAYTTNTACGPLSAPPITVTVLPAPAPTWTNPPADRTISCMDAESWFLQGLFFSNNASGTCLISGLDPTPDVVRDYMACGGTMTLTWTYDVGCYQDSYTQTLTVLPAPVPTFNSIVYDDELTCAEALAYVAPPRNFSNSLSGRCLITGTAGPTVVNNFDECGGTILVTWNADDICGRPVPTASITINVLPAPAPAWVSPPADITITCNEAPGFVPMEINYTNAGSGVCLIEGVATGSVSGTYDECGGQLTVNWSAPFCNSTLTHVQRVTVLPAPLPVWINPPPANITLSCSEAQAYTIGALSYSNAALDACLIEGTVDPVVVEAFGQCGGSKTFTWSFVDKCNRPISYTQTVHVESALPPAFTILPPDITIDCKDLFNFAPPDLTVTNGESGICLISDVVSPVYAPVTGVCGGSFYVTWNYVNPCNTAFNLTHRQKVTVRAAPPPVFSQPPADVTISCAAATDFEPAVITYTNGDLYCLISGKIEGKVQGKFDACGGEYMVTWDYADECGRPIKHKQKVTILPAPAAQWWEIPEPETLYCDQAEAYVAPGLKYTNMEPEGCLIEGVAPGKVTRDYDVCGGEIKVLYNFTDACGRTLSHEHNITVIPNPVANWTSLPPKIALTCEAAENYVGTPLGYSNRRSGGCLTEGSVMPTLTRNYTSCGGEIEALWTFTDECGRTIECKHTIPVLPAPKVQWVETPADITLSCADAEGYKPEALAYSNSALGACLIEGTVEGVLSGTIDHTGGDLTVMWMYADTCNNFLMHQQKITVEAPQAPSWTTALPADITLTCEEADIQRSTPLSFSNGQNGSCLIAGEVLPNVKGKLDDCGGDLYLDWYWTNGTYTLEHQQKVTVTPPAEAKFVDPPDADTLTYNEAIAFRVDTLVFTNGANGPCQVSGRVAGVLTNEFSVCGGSITVTWQTIDRCGRDIRAEQKIHVLPVSPVAWSAIFLPDTLSITEAEVFQPLARTFSNQDTGAANLVGSVNSTLEREYTICGGALIVHWSHQDTCGRTTAIADTILVTPAPIPRFIEKTLDSVMLCNHHEGYDLPDLVYTNGLTGRFSLLDSIKPAITIDSADCGGTLTAIYQFKDECDQTIEKIYTIKLIDTLKPVFLVVPADTLITCGEIPVAPTAGAGLEVFDNCILASITFGEVSMASDTPGVTRFVRTWVAKDACGNESIAQQHIEFRDCSKALTNLEVQLCAGETYAFNGQQLDKSGIYTAHLATYDGGDSTVVLDLKIGAVLRTEQAITLCAGESTKLGDQLIAQPGLYALTYKAITGCDSIVSYRVQVVESPKLEVSDMTICAGQTITLKVNNEVTGTLTWSSADAQLSCSDCLTPQSTPTNDAMYTVKTTGCQGEEIEAHLMVTMASAPELPALQDYVIGTNESVRLALDKNPGLSSSLYDEQGKMVCESCDQVTLAPRQSTTFMVKTAFAEGCTLERTFKVMVSDDCGLSEQSQINIISPNDDGINDLWEVINPMRAQLLDISIYNRQGEQLFHSTQADAKWDGKYNAVPVPEGVYLYKINFRCGKNKTSYLMGDITIVR